MGASGCGKTTLLSCIMGTKVLDSGSIKVLSDSVGNNKLEIGFMPQNTALIEEFTIKELFDFFGQVYGLNCLERLERFDFLSNLLELPDTSDLVRNLSGGQKRRVSLAICLIHQPKVLILDEPCVGLDPLLRHKIWSFMEDLAITRGTTIVISTHYIEEAKLASCVSLR
jgi:ABC-type multidrug transport system ATPase subunit